MPTDEIGERSQAGHIVPDLLWFLSSSQITAAVIIVIEPRVILVKTDFNWMLSAFCGAARLAARVCSSLQRWICEDRVQCRKRVAIQCQTGTIDACQSNCKKIISNSLSARHPDVMLYAKVCTRLEISTQNGKEICSSQPKHTFLKKNWNHDVATLMFLGLGNDSFAMEKTIFVQRNVLFTSTDSGPPGCFCMRVATFLSLEPDILHSICSVLSVIWLLLWWVARTRGA